jgi:ArsR family transcriptional regulator, arsenate/arsenite/antimonite-responsive transcriptional repressor
LTPVDARTVPDGSTDVNTTGSREGWIQESRIQESRIQESRIQERRSGLASGRRAPTIGPGGPCCAPLLAAPLTGAEAGELAKVFAALADPVRVRLFSLVAAGGEVCSCDLERPLGKSQPTVSHHTRVLADAGLIAGEKRGRWTMWRVVPERLTMLRAVLSEPT